MNTSKLRIPVKNFTYRPIVSAENLLNGFTLDDIQYLIEVNPYLRGYLQGYLAELSLQRQLEALPGVDKVTKIKDSSSSKGDLEVIYKGTPVVIEVKSVATNSIQEDPLTESWTGRVAVKNSDSRTLTLGNSQITTTNLVKGTFDILAISCFSVSGQWEFLFIENKYLPEAEVHPGVILTNIAINPKETPCLTSDPLTLLEKVASQKTSNTC